MLVQLSESPTRALRMQELADAILLSKSGLTRLVDRMEGEGLVERRPCPDDRRGHRGRPHRRRPGTPPRDAAPTHVAGVRSHFADLLRPGEAAVLAQALNRIADGSAEG